jgi:Tol biopolymer transport system component
VRFTSTVVLATMLVSVAACADGGGGAAPAGRIAFVTLSDDDESHIYAVDPDGSNLERLVDDPTNLTLSLPSLAWSPDGEEIAFTATLRTDSPLQYGDRGSAAAVSSADLFIFDLADNQFRQLTFTPQREEWNPIFSPDGRRVAFACFSSDNAPVFSTADLCIKGTDGTGESILTGLPAEGHRMVVPTAWHPDGTLIAYHEVDYETLGSRLRLITPDGEARTMPPTDMSFVGDAVWSPDGKTMAFGCADTPPPDDFGSPAPPANGGICLADADGSDVRRIVRDGGQPTWSPDGRWIAFVRDFDIYIMRSDGSDVRRITGDEGRQAFPVWRPTP